MKNQVQLMKQTLQRRNNWFCGVVFLCSIIKVSEVIDLLNPIYEDQRKIEFFKGFQLGIFIALMIVCVYNLARNLSLMNNEEALVNKYIYENDERNIKLEQMCGMGSYWIEICVLLFLAMVVGYLSFEGSIALIVATLVVIIIKNSLYLYYKNKI